jgi:hypothetical protein
VKDLYSTGSSLENAAFFDANRNVMQGIELMKFPYKNKQEGDMK